jgi:hypothetical protein
MSWFNQVTSTNDFERQSWRDSFNSGRAAGDLTGNVNRRLDAERAANGGATLSGSSTRYSALELAQRRHGVGAPASGGGSPAAGPGNPGVAQGPVVPGRPAGGSGPGSRLTMWNGWQLPVNDPAPVTRVVIGGVPVIPDQGMSDAGEIEQRYGESEVGSPSWFYSWGVAVADAKRTAEWYLRQASDEYRKKHGPPHGGGGAQWLADQAGVFFSQRLNRDGQRVFTGGGF